MNPETLKMDVISEDQALQAVLSGYNFSGIDNDALESDIQQLEEYINGENNICFPDDAMSQGSYNTERPSDTNSLKNSCSTVPTHTQPSTCTGPGPISYQNTHASGLNPPNPAYISGPLPDSPPDSGSEPYSPPEGNQDMKNSTLNNSSMSANNIPSISAQVYMMTPSVPPSSHAPSQPPPPPNTSAPGPPSHTHKMYHQTPYPPGEPPKLNHMPVASTQAPASSLSQMNPQILPSQFTSMNNTANHPNKKRRYSDSPQGTVTPGIMANMGAMYPIKQEPADVNGMLPDCSEEDYSYPMASESGPMFLDGTYQVIKWQAYQPTKWTPLYDENTKELPAPSYRVDADKGFTFSLPDDAFVCQKKNHFQITVHIGVTGLPKYVKPPEGFKKIDNFYLHFYGIKMESPSQSIKVEQSQSDRSKKPFFPVKVDLPCEQVTKVTVGRLHFSETTTNNMRKKGKPNPDQRYFMLVVALQAHCGDHVSLVAAHVSERIIVRASNPGQFDNDMDILWQKGHTPDSVFHAGRVGINTDRPDEALTIHGNVRVTGHVVQQSDERVKENFQELDPREQLKNVSQLKVYKYEYNKDYAETAGLSEDELEDTGVLAQELETVLPDAVKTTGDVTLENGETIPNFLVVNKDRIYMENVGAVKELCKLTDNLENRIDELEKMNKTLTKVKKFDNVKPNGSVRSIASLASVRSNSASPKKNSQKMKSQKQVADQETGLCSNRFIQITVIVLVLVMAFCLIAITTLFILERHGNTQVASDIGAFPPNKTTVAVTTPSVNPTTHVTIRTENPTTHLTRAKTTAVPFDAGSIHVKRRSSTPPSISPGSFSFATTAVVQHKNYLPKARCLKATCHLHCCPPPGLISPPTTRATTGKTEIPDGKNTHLNGTHPNQMATPKSEKRKKHKEPENDTPTLHYDTHNGRGGGGHDVGGQPIVVDIPHNNHDETHPDRELIEIATGNGSTTYGIQRKKRSAKQLPSVSVYLSEITEHIGDKYCVEPCNGTQTGNFSYHVLYSGHHALSMADLQFRSNTTVAVHQCDNQLQHWCEPFDDKPHYPRATKWVIANGSREFSLPIFLFFDSTYVFRITADHMDIDTICNLSSGLNTEFIEYTLRFERTCNY